MTKFKNIAAALVSLVIFSTATNAQTGNIGQSNNEPYSIKYIGSDDRYLLFSVSMSPAASGKGKFQVTDNEVGALYYSTLPKTFKVTTLKIEKRKDQVLNFRILTGKTVYSKSFSVNTNLVEHTTVSENDITSL